MMWAGMTGWILGAALLTSGLNAQQLAFFQAPATPPMPPQVFELHTAGGTYLGVMLAEVDANRARDLKLKEAYGVEITRVEDGSPADKAGIKPGDVVLEYNGQRVEGMEQFGRMVRETPAGREIKLQVSRGGAAQTILATLATRKVKAMPMIPPTIEIPDIQIPDMPGVFATMRSRMLGVEAEALGPQLAAYFGVKEGVLVRSVVKDTAAEKAGIRAGDVITRVDGAEVTTPNELSGAVHAAISKKTFTLELTRDHKDINMTVTVEDGQSMAPRTRSVSNDGH